MRWFMVRVRFFKNAGRPLATQHNLRLLYANMYAQPEELLFMGSELAMENSGSTRRLCLGSAVTMVLPAVSVVFSKN